MQNIPAQVNQPNIVSHYALWSQCCEELQNIISTNEYETWFSHISPISFIDNVLTLQVPSTSIYNEIEDRFISHISICLKKVYGEDIKLQYEIDTNGQPQNRADSFCDSHLSPAYRFDNYCIGDSNAVAARIALHLAEREDVNKISQLFVYGKSGVGKTHLLHAIGNKILDMDNGIKIVYMTANQFSMLLSEAVAKQEVPYFTKWFQEKDAILIDDLQELEEKELTTKKLLDILDYLRLRGKTIVITSSKAPSEFVSLLPRFKNRVFQGLVESIAAPEVSLCKKILVQKAKNIGLDLEEDAISLIVENCGQSCFRIESIVAGLYARFKLLKQTISIDMVKEVLATVSTERQ